MKWISIVGTRPQFIKVAPVDAAIRARNRSGTVPAIDHRIVNTGQHYDYEMAGLILKQLKIPEPRHHLNAGSGSHHEQLARVLERIGPVLAEEKPDWAIVYGDTNSALAGALAAARLGIPVAHVEAGCRSYVQSMPEEQNRVLVDHLSQVLFAASRGAADNLRREGIGEADDPRQRSVEIAGDVMYDTFLGIIEDAAAIAGEMLARLNVQPRNYYLLTLHRAENTVNAEQVRRILEVLENAGTPVIFPVHPRTRDVLARGGSLAMRNIRVVPPLGYLEFIAAGAHARKIITDSGGVQKEAFYLRTPCITLRKETEWPETVVAGANVLAGVESRAVLAAIAKNGVATADWRCPFGDGHAAERIVDRLLQAAGDECAYCS